MDIRTIEVGPLSTNCYILQDGVHSVIIDPGYSPGRLEQYILENGLKPEAILLTHGHFDHIMAVNELKSALDVTVYAGKNEEELLGNEAQNCCNMIRAHYTVNADRLLADGEKLNFGNMTCETIFTPGHTAGGVCYYFANEKVLFSGDTVFCGSCGRTDFPTGSMSALLKSINERLVVLPEDTTVYPGHGERTSISGVKQWIQLY